MSTHSFRSALALKFCVCFLLVIGSGSVLGALDFGRDKVVVSAARFLLADDANPPSDARDWSSVTLPDNWSGSRRDAEGIGWYRMEFVHGNDPSETIAVLVRRLSMNGEIFVNGVRVMSGGSMTPPVTRNWNTPFFVELPQSLLRAGRNVLDIRIYAYRNNNGGLGKVYLGKPAALRAQAVFLYALHVKGAIVSFAVTMLAAFIAIVAWLRMNRDAVYGLFGLSMVAWAVRYTNYFVLQAPIDPVAYGLVVNSAQGWFFIFFTPFLLRLAKLRWPRTEQALYVAGVLGMALLFAAFQGWVPLWLVIGVWLLVWLPGSVALLLVSTRLALRTRSVPATLVAVVAWLYVPLTIRELRITANLAPFDSSYIAHYVGMPLVVLIVWILIDRVVDSVRAAAASEIAQARAAFDERLRITQDMHDGLGLQLNAALRMVERGNLDQSSFMASLRGCLDELRLIVDSSASGSAGFLSLLGNLRFRMQPKLESIGLRIHWRMEQFPDALSLSPSGSLQILRMVQEVINNVIKHAHASTLEFESIESPIPDHIRLVIRDNGIGFPSDSHREGNGLIGMQRRAAAAGVGFHIHSSAAGTCVSIDIPTAPRHHHPRST